MDVVNVQFQTAAYDMHPSIHFLPGRVDPPVVVTFHDLRVPYLFPKAGPVREWSVQRLAQHAHGVIATDRADEARLLAWGVEPVRWIPIGSNVTTTPPSGCTRHGWRAERSIPQDALLISYFGFLNESKGGLDLAEALARLVAAGIDAHLVMIGGRAGSSDPTNSGYGRQGDAAIAGHGLTDRIHWTGFVADEWVSAAFLASDVTALPYRDGVSLRRGTLMAALAHGRAIVTTEAQTDIPELDGVVETAPPADPDGLADALEAVWRDPKRRTTLEAAARSASGHFRWDVIARRTADFFTEVLG
ncbi:MAG: glycosyltransferase, partial [Anaerolineae bacterium]